VINYNQHSRFLIQWLYLCHCFLLPHLSQRPPSETHNTFQPPQFSVDFIKQLTGTLSTILDYELLDFGTANACLDEAINAIQFAHDDDNSSSHSHSPSPQSSITSNQHKMSSNNLGTSAHQVPHIINVCTPMPPTPIHLHDGVDTGNPSDSPTNISSAFHEYDHLPSPAPTTERQSEHDRTFTTPSFSSSMPMDSSYGCNLCLPSNNEPCATLQPHEFVSNNKKEKQQKNGLTTIYTQNAQGLWHCPRDPDGNILVDKPPDLSKLEYLIDYMRQILEHGWPKKLGKKATNLTSTSRDTIFSATMQTMEKIDANTTSEVLLSSSPRFFMMHGKQLDHPL
jgi:hypothetical protein